MDTVAGRPVIGQYMASALGWYFAKVPAPYAHLLLMFLVLSLVNAPRVVRLLRDKAELLLESERLLAEQARAELGPRGVPETARPHGSRSR
jgi:ABC-type antimicrobial peptide transport system permease subunit